MRSAFPCPLILRHSKRSRGRAFSLGGDMSITSVSGSSTNGIQNQYQQVRNEFKQLGQDLQSGKLTQAQTDFVTLSQSVTSQLSATNPVAQTLGKIGQALQSGNLSAAQQAFSSMSTVGPSTRHSHGHGMGGKLSQSLEQLGQALQSGDISTAQQAFSAVQQIWQQMSGSNLTPNDTAVPTSTTSASA